jgi:hypothetical protein
MSLKSMLRDRVTVIKEDGREFPDLKAGVHPDYITVLDREPSLPITEGDVVTRQLPNGTVEEYDVLEVQFLSGKGLNFPPRFKLMVRKKTSRRPPVGGGTLSYQIFNVTGPNTRVNINSEDLSHNVVSVTPSELFRDIRQVFEARVGDAEERGRLVARLAALEAAQGTAGFGGLYVQFVSVLADHAGLLAFLAPYLPGLAQLAAR